MPELDCQSLPFGDQLNCFTDPNGNGNLDDSTPLHFTGKERDRETGEANGNDYFGARYFASGLGRFMTPDWSAKYEPVPYAKLDNPQTLNLYAYVQNNPLTMRDPDGHDDGGDGSGASAVDAFNQQFAEGAAGACGDGATSMCGAGSDMPIPAAATPQAEGGSQILQQSESQPAPTNPDGTEKSPGDDVPKLPDGKGPNGKLVPNEWVPVQGTGNRKTKWKPKYSIPGQSQPSASWDPDGHWDVDDGKGNRTRWLPGGGGQVGHGNVPISNSSIINAVKSITPGPILKLGTAGVVIYILLDEGSRVFPLRNAIPWP